LNACAKSQEQSFTRSDNWDCSFNRGTAPSSRQFFEQQFRSSRTPAIPNHAWRPFTRSPTSAKHMHGISVVCVDQKTESTDETVMVVTCPVPPFCPSFPGPKVGGFGYPPLAPALLPMHWSFAHREGHLSRALQRGRVCQGVRLGRYSARCTNVNIPRGPTDLISLVVKTVLDTTVARLRLGRVPKALMQNEAALCSSEERILPPPPK